VQPYSLAQQFLCDDHHPCIPVSRKGACLRVVLIIGFVGEIFSVVLGAKICFPVCSLRRG